MTNGSSQGLFVIVAVVIFGIFVVISYLLFRDKLQTGLASIFTDSINNNISIDSLFNNSIKEKEYTSTVLDKDEFLNSNDWDLAPLGDFYESSQIYTLTFELKTKVAGEVSVYAQNGNTFKYQVNPYKMYVNSKTTYQKYALTFKLTKANMSTKQALLAFYGVYDTGIIPTVKNVRIAKGNIIDSLDNTYIKTDYYK